jgi:hypothetical protein
VTTESARPGSREGHLAKLFGEAGLAEIQESKLSVSLQHETFDDWWEPYTLGVGPAGVYVAGLDADRQTQLREMCRTMLPTPPFTVTAAAWTVRAVA